MKLNILIWYDENDNNSSNNNNHETDINTSFSRREHEEVGYKMLVEEDIIKEMK